MRRSRRRWPRWSPMSDVERIVIVFDCSTKAFEAPTEWQRVLRTAEDKIAALATKPSSRVTQAPTETLYDSNGIVVGSVLVRRAGRWGCL